VPGDPDSGQVFVVLNCVSLILAGKMLWVHEAGQGGSRGCCLGQVGAKGHTGGCDRDVLSDPLQGVSSAGAVPHGVLVGVQWGEGVWDVHWPSPLVGWRDRMWL